MPTKNIPRAAKTTAGMITRYMPLESSSLPVKGLKIIRTTEKTVKKMDIFVMERSLARISRYVEIRPFAELNSAVSSMSQINLTAKMSLNFSVFFCPLGSGALYGRTATQIIAARAAMAAPVNTAL